LMSFSSILAAHIPHAVGAAYALQYRKEAGRAVLVTCGDGTTSEGEWHESMNFAAIHKLPLVMLVENNEWAISTPLDKQMAQPEIWKRAAGYGMPGKRFNGFDPIETYATVNEAMERARSGGGPTLIEGTCYRFLAHSTDDNDMTYRTKEVVAEARKNDPVPMFQHKLIEAGVMSEADVEKMKKDILRETNEATDKAEAVPYPKPSDLYTHLYEGAWQPWQ
jgi:2-oxoisovalerate dehydrogenase E1 component alpha subunit